jgi:hypothetical protein
VIKVRWIDSLREPKIPSNPAYPNGIDLDCSDGASPSCVMELPYPAKRCGCYTIMCEDCGLATVVTTAGRRDDPRSIKLACKIKLNH